MAAKKNTKKEEVEKEDTKTPEEEKETSILVPEKTPEPVEEKEEEKPEEKVEEETKKDDSKITSFALLDAQDEKPKRAKIVTEEVEEEKEEEKPKLEEEKDKDENDREEDKADDSDEKISSDEVKEWLKDVRPDTSKEVEKSGKPFVKVLLIVIVLIAIGGAVAGGIYYYKNSVNPTVIEKITLETEDKDQNMEEGELTPTPEEVDYSEVKVSILNGSGVAGEAGNVASLIEELGTAEPNTGNADSYDYTTTTISLKESVPSSLYESIRDSISEEYIVEMSDTPLEEDSSYDIIIIVGTKK